MEDAYDPPADAASRGAPVKRTPPPRTLREGADRVAHVLREAGYEAFFAGGCVRDALLGVAPKDFDITTNATPEQVAKLFRRTVMVGAAFGVVKVVLGKDKDYEVATYRSDGEYSDGRRPDGVVYAETAKEDVERRDFTINALLMDPRTDEIVDHVGGEADLEAGLIRAVGDPAVRFAEDRLRMLRAVRFAARFGFDIEAETLAAMAANAEHLSDVSKERVSAELEGILSAAQPGLGYRLLLETGLLEHALPAAKGQSVSTRRMVQDALSRLPEAAQGLTRSERVIVGWALLLAGSDPKAAEVAARDMKLSREQIRGVKSLLAAQDTLTRMEAPESAEVMRLLTSKEAPLSLALQRARLGPEAEAVARAEAARADLEARPLPPRPLITGQDLTKMGLKPGRHFKALLDAVDDAVLERRIATKDEALALVRDELGG